MTKSQNHPKIVALIPCYNGEPFLRLSVQSLINQTRALDSIIVIDDGSTDNSIESVDEYVKSGVLKVWINPRNLGKARSLNQLFDEIEADYFVLQDADDIALNNRVERQLAFMEANPQLGCSSGFIEYISGKGRKIGNGRLDLLDDTRLREYLAGTEPFGLFCPAVILRAEVVKNPNLQFREKFWPADDIDLWNRIAEAGWSVLAQPEVLVQYRIHGSSAVTSSFMKARMQFEWLRDCLRARRRGDPEPSREDFLNAWTSLSLHIRINRARKIYAKLMYRNAGFSAAESRWISAMVQLAVALALQPEYVFGRAISQWSKSRG
jgi:glycosyltransferase involved in cell wall biosynthesis